jgi:ubiquinone/menaquinone biosynthesis C-methylase UbiE
MVRKLDKLPYIKAADVGCGDGRYNRILYRDLGEKLSLTCVDANANMLEALRRNLIEDGIQNFTSIQSSAEDMPLPDNSYDCIFTLNAIHHFDTLKFIHESVRILKSGGYLFVYTRLRDQNKRNIWGRYFPEFHQKETRLHTLNTMARIINAVPGMWLQSIEYFKYRRLSSLSELEKRIRSHHYSTFFLYPVDELEKAIEKFKKTIGRVYEDINRIHWHDENVLFIIRKGEESIYNSES